jgi:hypothetical protein
MTSFGVEVSRMRQDERLRAEELWTQGFEPEPA